MRLKMAKNCKIQVFRCRDTVLASRQQQKPMKTDSWWQNEAETVLDHLKPKFFTMGWIGGSQERLSDFLPGILSKIQAIF